MERGVTFPSCGEALYDLFPSAETDDGRWRRRVEAFSEIADLIKASDEDLERLFPGDGIDRAISRWSSCGV